MSCQNDNKQSLTSQDMQDTVKKKISESWLGGMLFWLCLAVNTAILIIGSLNTFHKPVLGLGSSETR